MKNKKSFLTILILAIVIILGGAGFYYTKYSGLVLPSFVNKHFNIHTTGEKYIVKKAGQVVSRASTEEDAIEKAKKVKRSIAVNTYTNKWVYTDLLPYFIITDTAVHDFSTFGEAYQYAISNGYIEICYEDNQNIIWRGNTELEDTKLNIPMVLQLPELPRGCEVTSLAMILKYRGIDVNKLTLAKEVKKDTTPYRKEQSGRIYYGNPYDGFVGDIYDMKKNGYGVYHGPIVELAEKYCQRGVLDLTDLQFEDVLYFVEKGNPVWVITNAAYSPLQDQMFEMWHTPTGIVKITKKLHSVVVTGFTKDKVYINDPLTGGRNLQVNREAFRQAWEQMGNQAMTIIECQ